MDIALFLRGQHMVGDVELVAGALQTDAGLETSVILSLFSDARAGEDDELPPGVTSRGGWCLEGQGDDPNDKFGSKFWLRKRLKQTEETRRIIEDDARAALAWMVKDGVALRVTVAAEWISFEKLGLAVLIARPSGEEERFRFEIQWAAQEEKR